MERAITFICRHGISKCERRSGRSARIRHGALACAACAQKARICCEQIALRLDMVV